MSQQNVFEIPGKLQVFFDTDHHTIIDKWINYGVTLQQFEEAVIKKGLPYAKSNNGKAWIVDSSEAKGAFSQEIQDFIASTVFKKFSENGIKFFITITSQSAVTNLSIKNYQSKLGPHGIKLVEASNIKDALQWLKTNS